MNGRTSQFPGAVTWLVFGLSAAFCLLPSAQAAAPEKGWRGQAHGHEVFSFADLAERERQDGTPLTPPPPGPKLRKTAMPRGHVRPALPPVTPLAPAEQTVPAASAGADLGFTAAASGVPSPPPSASFQAVPDDDTSFNPDTQGAVGPNHLMATLSSQVRVQDRAGSALQTLTLRAFWGVASGTNLYDPRVLYDRAAQRWIATAVANPGANNAALLIAVSQTPDPTGTWIRRTIRTDLNVAIFPDSPNVGLTRDWITVSANMYDKTNYAYFSCDIWVFNKASLYAGGTGQFTFFRYLEAYWGDISVLVPVVNYDNGTTNMLVSNFDGNYDTGEGNFGYLRLFSITGPVGAEVFNDFSGPGGTNGIYVGVVTPWENFAPDYANFAPQKGTANKIYIGDARIQNVVYRDGFLWICQHIFFPNVAPNRVAVQWMSTTPGGTIDQLGYLNDATRVKSYAYPSLAVNSDGDVLVGFTSFSANQYPTAGYAFHSYQDGPGALRLDGVLKAGETNFFIDDAGINHWGDWSATAVDPVNDEDLWTIQEYAATHVAGESRWGTWWGRVSPLADVAVGQSDSPDPVTAGANVTYSVSVTNQLFTAATGVRATATLPLGSFFVSASTPSGSCGHTNGVVTCNFGDLAGGAFTTASIVARLDQSGTATNTVSVSGYGPDTNPGNNTVRVLTTVNPSADLTVLMSAGPVPVTVSNVLTYLITATNRGPSLATSVQLTDTLPPGSIFVSATPGLGTCSQNGGVVNCNLGTLPNNGAVTVNLQVRPTAAGQVTNRANVTTSAPDPASANNAVTNITRANAAPTMQAISNRTINEDSTLPAIDFTIGDAETPAANLVLTGASSDPAIVPNNNIIFGGSGSLRNVSVVPLPNANGSVTITRTVTDAEGGATSNSFVLTITAVNDPPTISDIPNQTASEDQVLGPIPFTVGDVESAPAALSVSGASSNPALIPNANITFGGSGASRTISLRPTTNQVGTATITVTVSDGSATTNDSFVVTVNRVNHLPTISDLPDRSINEDATLGPLSFTVGDLETSATALLPSGFCSNPALVPTNNFTFGGSGSNRTVTIMPAPNEFGSGTITIAVTDSDGGSGIDTFLLTVNPVNDPPTVGAPTALTINENAGLQTVTLTNITAGASNENQAVTFSVISSNPQLIPSPTVNYTSPSTVGVLQFTTVTNASGVATLTLTANDGGASNNITTRPIVVTVNPVNHPPVLGTIPAQVIDEDATVILPFYVSDLETPGDRLTLRAFSSNEELLDGSGISFGGSGTNRTLILTPLPDASGSSTVITLSVTDEGGLRAETTFELSVRPINDAPTITGLANRTINENSGPTAIPFGVNDPETLPSELLVTASSSNPSVLPNSNLSLSGSGSARTLTVTPLPEQTGMTTIQIVVRDGPGATAASTTNSFVLTVAHLNNPPTLDPVADRTINEDSGPQTVNLTGISSGTANEGQMLVVTATSDDPARIPNPVVSYTSPSSTGLLTFTPALNATGAVTLRVTVNDGGLQNPTVTRPFVVTLTPINDPPILGGLGAATVDENAVNTLPFTVTDPESPPASLSLSASSSNQTLLPDANISITGTGSNRVLTLTTLPGQLGTVFVSVRAQDPEGARVTNTFPVTIVLGNHPPTLDPIAPVTMLEDEAPRSIPLTGITAGPPNETERVSITATSSDASILPNPAVTYFSPATTGSLLLAPRPNSNGVVTVTVTVNDGQRHQNLFSRTFSVTITPANDAPIILPVDNQSTPEDVPAVVTVNLLDFDSPPANLTLTAASSNTGLVAPGGISVTGAGLTRTVTLTPVLNQSGFTFITLVAGDGSSLTSTSRFQLAVQPVNDPPTISDIANTNLNEDTQLTVPFTVGDLESPAAQLTLTASSSDPALLPLQRITFGGNGTSRTMTLAPTTNRTGTTTVTVTVSDPDGASASDSFVVTVNGVNDPPTLTGLPNLSISHGTSTGPLPVTIWDLETPAANLSLVGTSSNLGLIPNANIVIGGSGVARTVTVTPVGSQTGTAIITLTLTDGNGANTNTSFTVVVQGVQGVNTPPTLNTISNLTLNEDPGPQSVSLSGISAGGGESQSLTVQAVSSNPSLIPNPTVTYTSPNSTGTLSFTPVTNAVGTATITVTVSDGQATDATFNRSFTVTLNPVNDRPSISNIPDQQTPEDTPLTVAFTVGDADNAAFRLTLTGTSSSSSLVAATNIFFSGSGSNRTVTVVPSPDQSGTATITVFVTDGLLTNSDSFVLTVNAVNDAPTLNPIPNFSANAANGNPSFVINLSGIGSGAANESQTLTITATSSSTSVLPNPSVSYSSPNSTGTLTLRPGNNTTGKSTITVTVSDGGSVNNTIVRTFVANFKPSSNVLPTLSIIPTLNLNEDTSTNVTFQVRDAETAVGSLTVSAFSSNQQLLPNSSLIITGTGTNRTLALTPVASRSGTASVTLGVIDGNFGASNMTFTVNVLPVNDPPTLTGIPSQSINDGTSTPLLTFTVNDLETPPANLTVTATSGNQTLVPNANLILGGSGTDRALLVTPAPNQIGTAVITVSVSDGSASTNVQFTLTVNAFNDPPTISDISDQNVAAGTSTAAIPFVIGDQETPAANLTLTAVSANAALVPDAAVVFGGSGSNRTVTVTPASGVSGSSLITVRVSDGTNQVSDTFTVTVSGGSTTPGTNLPPTLDPINDIVLSQSGAPRPVTVTGIGAGAANENQTLILAASSSDPSVVPHPLINYTSPAATATLTLVAAPFATGSVTITVTLSDGQPQNGTTTRTFTAAVNTAPLIAGLGNTSIPEDSSGTSLSFTVSDADDSPQTLAVTASSSNPALLPAAGVVVGGAGNNRTLTLTPLPDLFGFSTVTVSVSDANGNTNSQSLLVTVLAVNDAPTLAPLADLQLSSSAGTQTVNLSGIGSGAANETQVLSVSATSSEPAFVPNPAINYTSPSATGTVTFTPIAGAASSAIITVVVQDNGGIANGGADRFSRTFTVTRPGPPALQIVPTGGVSAQISWPGDRGSGWTLESNPQLDSAGTWSAVPGAPVLINGRYTVTVSLGGQSLFYRLRQ